MNILYDYQIFLSQKFGGPSRYFIELTRNINKLNGNSVIYSPFYINQYLKAETDKSFKKKFFLRRKIKLNFLYNYFNKVLTKKFMDTTKFDILHPTYYDIQKYKKIKIPKVLTVYDLTHEKFPEYYGLPKNHKIKKDALEIADHFLCPSNATKNDLMEIYNINENKISVIYWAPFLSSYTKIVDKNYQNPFLLFVGNRHKYKNAYKFLEAFSKNKFLFNNFRIIFFGGGKFSNFEKKTINKLNLEKKITLINGSDNELINLYKNAEALVYPSQYEGLGLPILESMSHGCPVITSYSSGMLEAGGKAVEYFDPNNIESISSSIVKVLESKNYAKKLINSGYDQVKHFSWQLCSKQTFEIYKKLL